MAGEMEGARKAEPAGPSSLGRVYQELGVEDFDGVMASVCEGCPVVEACGKMGKCRAFSVIAAMAVDMTLVVGARILAPDYMEKVKKGARSSTFALPKRILAVDDQRVTLLLVRRILLKAGFEADTASSPGEALRFIEEREYDLVLLDVQIPGHPVEETVRAVRQRRPETTVLLMTGGASMSEIERARAVGAIGPVLKPFEAETLLEAVRGCISQARFLGGP